jgi:hypothetical protein
MPEIVVDSPEVVEGDGTFDFLDFTVSLTEPAESRIDVPYRLFGGTAVAPADFDSAEGVLRLDPGELFGTVRARIRRDEAAEADESVILEVRKPPNADLLNQQDGQQAVGWILDDDGAGGLSLFASGVRHLERSDARDPAFEIALSQPAPSELVIPYDFAGSARAGRDYAAEPGELVIPAGARSGRIEVDVLDDALREGRETVDLELTLPPEIAEAHIGQIEILDDERALPEISVDAQSSLEGNGTFEFVRFAVSLSEPSDQRVDLDWRTIAGTVSEPGDFDPSAGSIRFDPGETLAVLRARFRKDDLPEADETIGIELSNPQNAVLAGDATFLRDVAFVLDDDGGQPQLALAASDLSILEGDAAHRTASLALELSRPAPTGLVVDYTLSSATAEQGTDYLGAGGQVVFQRGASSATVEIRIAGDDVQETVEFVDIAFSGPPILAPTEPARITIRDNDGPGVLTAEEVRTVAYLYEAGLDRDGDIDLPGLNFWIDQRAAGLNERGLAAAFLESDEFQESAEAFLGGGVDLTDANVRDPAAFSNADYVTLLYENVLDREADQSGFEFWLGVLDTLLAGPQTAEDARERLLVSFAGSGENVAGSPEVAQLAEVDGDWAFLG